MKPLVFVAMPFGKKKDSSGQIEINFDLIYKEAIEPAILELGYDVIRADEEHMGGFIHLPMYERLLASEFVIADLTFANANVYYELGIRHAVKPKTTIMLFADNTTLLFDVRPLRALSYNLTNEGLLTEDEIIKLKIAIQRKIKDSSLPDTIDSPIFQLVPGMTPLTLAEERLQSFKDRAMQANQLKTSINTSKKLANPIAKLRTIEQAIEPISQANLEIVFELFIAYRDIQAWDEMINLEAKMNDATKENKQVLEQLALALNRRNQNSDVELAKAKLAKSLELYGDNPETNGILGRVYKDNYDRAVENGELVQSEVYLQRAISEYRKGFNVDPRDVYPGINLAFLLTLINRDDAVKERESVLQVLKFILSRTENSNKNLWELASLMQVYCLLEEWDEANAMVLSVLEKMEYKWQAGTVTNDLKRVVKKYKIEGRASDQIEKIITMVEEFNKSLS